QPWPGGDDSGSDVLLVVLDEEADSDTGRSTRALLPSAAPPALDPRQHGSGNPGAARDPTEADTAIFQPDPPQADPIAATTAAFQADAPRADPIAATTAAFRDRAVLPGSTGRDTDAYFPTASDGSATPFVPDAAPADGAALIRPLLSTEGKRGPLSGAVWPEYRLGDLLGQGAMATVYLAERIADGTLVALKVLPGHHADDPVFQQRFELEATIARRLQHPHVAAVHAAGKYGDAFYLELELIEGGTLQDRIAERKTARQPFTVQEICTYGIHLASALEAADAEQLVHRDIKPGNLLLTREGVGKLADFGIVKVLGEQTLTMTGSTVGTPVYMSPEQGRGDVLDIRSDLYAAGALLYELTCFAPPFDADSADSLVYQHNFADPPLLCELRPDCPADLQAVIFTCLQKRCDRRYADPVDLRRDLEAVRDGQPVETWLAKARSVDAGGRAALRAVHGRSRLRIVLTLVLILVLALAWLLYRDQRQREAEQLQARLAVIDDPRPLPDNASRMLGRLEDLLGTGHEDVQRWRATLARVADQRRVLAGLEQEERHDWQWQQGAEAAVRSLARDCGEQDADVQVWQIRLQEHARMIQALRERLKRLDLAAIPTLALLDELAPDLATAQRVLPPEAPDLQRWLDLRDQCLERAAQLREQVQAGLDAQPFGQSARERLQQPVHDLASLLGRPDALVEQARDRIRASQQREARLRSSCARLDQGAVASAAAIAATAADLEQLTALVGDGDPDLQRWLRRRAESRRIEQGLRADLEAMAEQAVLSGARQERFTVALAELRAISGADDAAVRAWQAWLAEQRSELANLQDMMQSLQERQVFSQADMALLEEILPRLTVFGVLDAAAEHHLRGRMERSRARIADLRQQLQVLDTVTPRQPERVQVLQRFLELVGGEDPDARRWQQRLTRLEDLHHRLAALDRRQAPPPDAEHLLDAYQELVGPLDADLVRWRQRLQRIGDLRATLVELDEPGLPSEGSAERLVELVRLIGTDEQRVRLWQDRVQAVQAVADWLPAFEARLLPAAEDAGLLAACRRHLGAGHDWTRRAEER
ncbi:MAG: protein kinase domain-containing protein, partial [Planctomycetota bacterium]